MRRDYPQLTKTENDILWLIENNKVALSNDKYLYVLFCEQIEKVSFDRLNFIWNCPMPETVRRSRQSLLEKIFKNPQDFHFTDWFWKELQKNRELRKKQKQEKRAELGYNPQLPDYEDKQILDRMFN